MSRLPRAAVAASAVVIASLACAEAGHAAVVDTSFNYTCTFPWYRVAQPVSVDIETTTPSTQSVLVARPLSVSATLRLGVTETEVLDALNVASLEGVTDPGSAIQRGLLATITPRETDSTGAPLALPPLTVPLGVPEQSVDPSADTVTLSASGVMPGLSFSNPGTITYGIGDFTGSLIARGASGSVIDIDSSNVTGADTGSFDFTCALDHPLASDVIATQSVTAAATPTPTPSIPPTPTPFSGIVSDPSPIPPPVTPTPTPILDPTPTPTPTVIPDPPSPSPAPTSPHTYAVAGSSTLKSLVKGTVSLSGSATATFGSSGQVVGDLSLAPSTATLVALGFLPVTATVDVVPTAQVTGTYTASTGALSATAKVRIKLPSIKTLGITIAGGANCQAAQVSTIPLKSVGSFVPSAGGTVAGTFAISNLTGCGALNGIVSPLTSGNGNTLSLKLGQL